MRPETQASVAVSGSSAVEKLIFVYFCMASWKVFMSGAVENHGCVGALLIALLKSAVR